MNPNIPFETPFETVLQLLVMAHITSVMLLLAVSNACLAVIETLEEAYD